MELATMEFENESSFDPTGVAGIVMGALRSGENLSKTVCRIIRQEPDSIFVVIAGCVAALAALVISATVAFAGSESGKTFAIVDGHAITQQDLDTTIAVEIYQIRRRELDRFIDNYLLEQAARRAHLTVPEYLDKE